MQRFGLVVVAVLCAINIAQAEEDKYAKNYRVFLDQPETEVGYQVLDEGRLLAAQTDEGLRYSVTYYAAKSPIPAKSPFHGPTISVGKITFQFWLDGHALNIKAFVEGRERTNVTSDQLREKANKQAQVGNLELSELVYIDDFYIGGDLGVSALLLEKRLVTKDGTFVWNFLIAHNGLQLPVRLTIKKQVVGHTYHNYQTEEVEYLDTPPYVIPKTARAKVRTYGYGFSEATFGSVKATFNSSKEPIKATLAEKE